LKGDLRSPRQDVPYRTYFKGAFVEVENAEPVIIWGFEWLDLFSCKGKAENHTDMWMVCDGRTGSMIGRIYGRDRAEAVKMATDKILKAGIDKTKKALTRSARYTGNSPRWRAAE
jgi:hypothetical protein